MTRPLALFAAAIATTTAATAATTTALRRALPSAALAAVAACAALAGCASLSHAPLSRAAVAPYRQDIDLAGRLSVNYSHDGKHETVSGKFTWQQTASRTEVTLYSPLGQTIATIVVAPGYASLTEAGKRARVAADIDSLSAQTLGWSLPVGGLREWLQGYARGADGSRFIASPANSGVTTRDGWRLDYVSWQDEDAAVPRPKRIDLARVAPGQFDEMQIRIVIDPAAAP